MQVSIITPLFNRLDLTRVFLASLGQTLRRWQYEVILVDDGSTDGTREFLQTLSGPRYRVVLNAPGSGYAASNNLAARLASAPLLCLLNNDTVLLPRWLEPMARLASLLPDVACVGNVQREPVGGLIDHYVTLFPGGRGARPRREKRLVRAEGTVPPVARGDGGLLRRAAGDFFGVGRV